MVRRFLGSGLVAVAEAPARVLLMVAKEVLVGEEEAGLAAVVAKGIASELRSDVGWVSGSSQVDFVVRVSGSPRRVALVHLLLVSRVGFSQTCICTVIRLVWVQLIRGSIQCETCASVDLRSSIGRVAWIVAIRPRLLSEQPVLPELLADSELGVVVRRWGSVRFQLLVRGL